LGTTVYSTDPNPSRRTVFLARERPLLVLKAKSIEETSSSTILVLTMMLPSAIVAAAARRSVLVQQPQRRGFLNWMTNYPDRVSSWPAEGIIGAFLLLALATVLLSLRVVPTDRRWFFVSSLVEDEASCCRRTQGAVDGRQRQGILFLR